MADILQWNIRGLRANFEELQCLAKHFHPSVLALQECMLAEPQEITLNTYQGIFKHSSSGSATAQLLGVSDTDDNSC